QGAAQLGDKARVAEEQTLRSRGIDLAGAARDAERGALDERDDAVDPDARAGAGRPGLRHRRETTTGTSIRLVLADGSRLDPAKMPCTPRVACAPDANRGRRPGVVHGTPDGIRRHRAR